MRRIGAETRPMVFVVELMPGAEKPAHGTPRPAHDRSLNPGNACSSVKDKRRHTPCAGGGALFEFLARSGRRIAGLPASILSDLLMQY
jgi:hypothetical protein